MTERIEHSLTDSIFRRNQFDLVLLAIVFGTCLAAVHINLSDRIAENKLNESLERIPGLIWKQGEGGAAVEIMSGRIDVKKKDRTLFYPVFQVIDEGKPAGWVIKAAGQGYADKIELLVGLDSSAQSLTGIFVLDQKETPGLGNKIVTNEWRSQFKGKGTARELVVVKGGAQAPHEIDSITGATISSKTVSDIVNATVNDLRSSLAAKATPGAS